MCAYMNDNDVCIPVLFAQPQGDYIELHNKRYGRQLDYEERKRKKEARKVHKDAQNAQKLIGLKVGVCVCVVFSCE